MQDELARLRTGDDAALAAGFVRARRRALETALAAPTQISATVDAIEIAVTSGRPVDEVSTLPAEIGAVTLADARAEIAQDLDPAHLVAMVSGAPG